MLKKHNKIHGLTLIEIIISLAILVTLALAMLAFQVTSRQRTAFALDKSFAGKKAISLLEETRLAIEQSSNLSQTLNDLEDGTDYKEALTIKSGLSLDHPLSGNIQSADGWKWSRKINISSLGYEASENIKMVKVTVAINKKGYELDPAGTNGTRLPLASVGAIVHAPAQKYPPTQSYDLYLLTSESSPSWWVHMSQIKPFTKSVIDAIQAQNPGLQLRTHWMTVPAYGRNPLYLPYINESLDCATDTMAYAYIYPGKHPSYINASGPSSGQSCPSRYYDYQSFQGRIKKDSTVINDWDNSLPNPTDTTNPPPAQVYNPFPHAITDRFNHGMRYLEELDYYAKKKTARDSYISARRSYINNSSMPETFKNMVLEMPPEEPTFRMLLEDMNTNPDKYHNAIFLNLHGEMLPLPALRNYSDAAKDPETYPGIRVVTHPERIMFKQDAVSPYQANAHDAKFRVYSYLSDPSTTAPGYGSTYTNSKMPVPITLVFRNMDLTGNINDRNGNGRASLIIQRIYGGYTWTKSGAPNAAYGKETTTDLTGNSATAAAATANTTTRWIYQAATETTAADTVINTNEMYATYRVITTDYDNDGTSEYHTVVYLYNSPLTCPVVSGQGLDSTKRLEGLEYIPSSPNGNITFAQDLTNNTTDFKNTARWVITIPKYMVAPSGGTDPDTNNTVENTDTALTASPVRTPKVVFHVETRIGTDLGNPDPAVHYQGVGVLAEKTNSSGTMYPPASRYKPENISKTYAWWTSKITEVPFTELFQYLGDPRHNPYVDNIKNTADCTVGDGYNPYHRAIANATPWSSLVDTTVPKNLTTGNPGWGPDYIEIDIPRYFQVLRRAIVNSELLYTTLTGYSYYYAGVGGEIGSDASNAFDQSIRVNQTAWGSPGTIASVSEYTSNQITYILRQGTTNFGLRNWIGELYHDADHASWRTNGNVTAGSGSGLYLRVYRDNAAFGLTRSGHRLAASGCGSLLRVKNASSQYFRHVGADGTTATIATDGTDLTNQYALSLPTTISASRPFNITWGSQTRQYDVSNAASWNTGFFNFYTPTVSRTYFSHPNLANGVATTASSLLTVQAPATVGDARDLYLKTGNTGYVMMNGISPTTNVGVSLVAKLATLTLLHSFLELGKDYKARQLPKLEIISPRPWEQLPSNPTSVTLKWKITWKRWDGKPYTTAYLGADRAVGGTGANTDIAYPPTIATGLVGTATTERNNLYFVPIITRDLTQAWTDLVTNQLTESGNRPNDYTDYAPGVGTMAYDGVKDEFSFTFDTSNTSDYPAGNYYIRVECFRKNEIQHYAYHQLKVEIRR